MVQYVCLSSLLPNKPPRLQSVQLLVDRAKYPMAFLNNLEAEIKNEPLVSDRFWLLEKLEELKTAQTLKNNRPR